MKQRVIELRLKYKGWGKHKLQILLKKEGIEIGQTRIQKIINEVGLKRIPKAKSKLNIDSFKHQERLCIFTPPIEWFLAPKTIDSIDRLRHIMRCLVYVGIISDRLGVDENTLRVILLATAIHDCR